jgi:uncharacterized phage protein (TIGR02218 family)
MRSIPTALQTKLDSGVTTLCRCWRVTRRDSVVLGFTDHDEDITLEGVVCRANSGLTASEATQLLGLATAGLDISGALSGDSLSEDDLAAGRYDAADIEMWLVDWSDPSLAVLLVKGVIGEVRREATAFTAELRSLANRLDEESGRLFTATCSADLGDARCTIDLGDPEFRGSGTVAALTASASFQAAGLDSYASTWFTAGKVTFTSGANIGTSVEVKTHRVAADGVFIDLWQAVAQPIAIGDSFTVTAGCDKRFATCRDRFNNAINFRGFPAIPGDDFVMSYAVQGAPGNDGRSLTPTE